MLKYNIINRLLPGKSTQVTIETPSTSDRITLLNNNNNLPAISVLCLVQPSFNKVHVPMCFTFLDPTDSEAVIKGFLPAYTLTVMSF
jgi:hypothetical protein